MLHRPIEFTLYGKTNAERGIGAGVSAFDAGLRIRYEFRREFAPYVGVIWTNVFGQTADFAASRSPAACRFRHQ